MRAKSQVVATRATIISVPVSRERPRERGMVLSWGGGRGWRLMDLLPDIREKS